MYIDRPFIYLTLIILVLMLLRMWRNEKRLERMEHVYDLLYKHGCDVDRMVQSIVDVLDKMLKGILECANKKKESENGPGREGAGKQGAS